MTNWWKTFCRGWIMLALFIIPAVAGLVRLVWMICSGDLEGAKRGLTGLDMAINATALRGNPFETISSHCGRIKTTWWACGIIWITDWLEKDHCTGAAAKEAPLLELIAKHKTGSKH